MPMYDFECLDCGLKFEAYTAEVCIECESTDVDRLFPAPAVLNMSATSVGRRHPEIVDVIAEQKEKKKEKAYQRKRAWEKKKNELRN